MKEDWIRIQISQVFIQNADISLNKVSVEM